MNLKEYLESEKVSPIEFSVKVHIGLATIYRYLHGKKASFQKARKIEEYTKGKITFKELRGESGPKTST